MHTHLEIRTCGVVPRPVTIAVIGIWEKIAAVKGKGNILTVRVAVDCLEVLRKRRIANVHTEPLVAVYILDDQVHVLELQRSV